MATTNGARSRDRLLKELVSLMRELPREQLIAVADYAHKLQGEAIPRGTAEAVLTALDRVGPLQFDPEELDRLMHEIEAMRRLDFDSDEDDSVSA